MTKKRRMYLNDKQLQFLTARQKTRVAVWGRGAGKSHTIGLTQRKKAAVMPRSRGFLSSTTYNQLLTKTWPGIEASWELFGLKEGIHYVFGVQPPKHFEKPLSRVRKYSNIITFSNGRIIEFLSMDRPDLARGGSYDDGDIDEAALVKQEQWTKILLPSIRGNLHRFHYTHWHQCVGMYTSMPWKSTGLYILDYKEKAKENPEDYLYLEATAYDNIHILGKKGIDRMKAEMSYAEFQMEVMNKHTIRTEEPFYPTFDPDIHPYEPKFKYGNDDHGRITVQGMTDVDPQQLLEVSCDFGGWFSCFTVYQEKSSRRENMVASFHVKSDQKLSELVRKFCVHFAEHKYKMVRLWGEPRGHDKNATMKDTIYDLLVKEFTKYRWRVEVMAPRAKSRLHVERQVFMESLFAEDTKGYPSLRINQETCKPVIIALMSAQKLPDGRKDKGNEKDRDFPQEHATHYTDTVDYYFDQKWGPRLSSSAGTRGMAGTVEFI
jgi:hypothetical protein